MLARDRIPAIVDASRIWFDPKKAIASAASLYINWEKKMNEDVFNMSIRKFLKKVGVTAQRSIEVTIRESLSKGRLKGNETLPVKVTLTLDRADLNVVVDGEIELE